MNIQYNEENAAFEDDGAFENARILRKLANLVENGESSGVLYDLNGNRVGTWEAGNE